MQVTSIVKDRANVTIPLYHSAIWTLLKSGVFENMENLAFGSRCYFVHIIFNSIEIFSFLITEF